MSKITLTCPICGTHFDRNKKEYNRSQRVGRPSYCSRSCSGKANIQSLGRYVGDDSQLRLHGYKRKADEFSKFRYFLRRIKSRDYKKGKSDIDLPYLKELWVSQEGKCPFTGWDLILPNNSSKRNDRSAMRASIDRIDNNKGYIKGNIRYVAVMANYCRNSFSDDEVKMFCEAVVRNRNIL
mgnify:FL=1